MFEEIKNNHLAHIESDMNTLKADVSFIKDRLMEFEDKLNQTINK